MNGKPDWKDAPKWAKFLAQDSYGAWCWHEKEPSPIEEHVFPHWSAHYGKCEVAISSSKDWQNTLEKRPQ